MRLIFSRGSYGFERETVVQNITIVIGRKQVSRSALGRKSHTGERGKSEFGRNEFRPSRRPGGGSVDDPDGATTSPRYFDFISNDYRHNIFFYAPCRGGFRGTSTQQHVTPVTQ